MKHIIKLTLIGFIAGLILMAFLKIIQILSGSEAYILLFNFDYVPLIKNLKPVWLFGYIFHFMTCIISVIALFYILKNLGWQNRILPYVLVYTIGGGGLYFLTALSDQPPAANDAMAWLNWTIGHLIFGYAVGLMIKKMERGSTA